MSARAKLNVAFWTFILSVLGAAGTVTWTAAVKANDIDVAKQDISGLRQDMQIVMRSTTQLEERSKNAEKVLDTLGSRLHGISSAIGGLRSDVREAHEN